MTYDDGNDKYNKHGFRPSCPPVIGSRKASESEIPFSLRAGTYLQQEIVAGGAVRNIPAFSRFLRIAALCNSSIVNFTSVANDAQVARTTIYEYFEILKDTLILRELAAWRKSKKRKPLASSKYYFLSLFRVYVMAADHW